MAASRSSRVRHRPAISWGVSARGPQYELRPYPNCIASPPPRRVEHFYVNIVRFEEDANEIGCLSLSKMPHDLPPTGSLKLPICLIEKFLREALSRLLVLKQIG